MNLFQRKKPRRIHAEVMRPIKRVEAALPPSLQPHERALAVLAFALVTVFLAMDPGLESSRVLGLVVLVFGLVFLAGRYFLKCQREVVQDLGPLVAILATGLVALLVARLARDSMTLPILLVPIPAVAILFAVLLSPRFAIEATVLLVALCAIVLWEVDGLLPTLLTLGAGALTGALYSFRVRKPSRLIAVGFLVGTTQVLVLAAVALYREEALTGGALPKDLLLGFGHGLISGLLVLGLFPVFEHLLHRLSDITLLEYSNPNEQPVLRRLQVEARGTHHHSSLVAALAETGAEAIGANGLLCRVGAYFHDIGKMNKPEYFSENSPDARSLHAQLSPEMSRLIITAHVKDGAELAKLYGIPAPIRAFIEEHHGTTAVEYFYRLAATQRPDQDIPKESYRYPGPKPRTKETAIAMVADSVEAASRTLRDPTPGRLEQLIGDIVNMKMKDGQLDDCGLTMREIARVREAFLNTLLGIYHRRPRYPKDPTGKLAVPLAEDDLLPELEAGRLPLRNGEAVAEDTEQKEEEEAEESQQGESSKPT